jgi:cytochrome P450
MLGITIIAGRETTTSMLACGAWEIMHDDDALAVAVAGGERMPVLVDELLRLLSVADSIPIRVSKQDQELSGCPIHAGDGVIALLGAANHDPEVFEDPDRLRLDRETPIRHLAFGFGLHHCIGHHLARVELEVGLHTLFRRLPGLRPTVDMPPLNNGSATFGVHELPVAW